MLLINRTIELLGIISLAKPGFTFEGVRRLINEYAKKLDKKEEDLKERLFNLTDPNHTKGEEALSDLIKYLKTEQPPSSIEAFKELDYDEETLAQHGFGSKEEMTCYAKLRAICVLGSYLENSNQNIVFAYKLTVIFGDDDAAIKYLKEYNQKNKSLNYPMHDACLFNISPPPWDLDIWRELAKKNMLNHSFFKAIGFAPKIEEIHKNIAKLSNNVGASKAHKFIASKSNEIFQQAKQKQICKMV